MKIHLEIYIRAYILLVRAALGRADGLAPGRDPDVEVAFRRVLGPLVVVVGPGLRLRGSVARVRAPQRGDRVRAERSKGRPRRAAALGGREHVRMGAADVVEEWALGRAHPGHAPTSGVGASGGAAAAGGRGSSPAAGRTGGGAKVRQSLASKSALRSGFTSASRKADAAKTRGDTARSTARAASRGTALSCATRALLKDRFIDASLAASMASIIASAALSKASSFAAS